MSKYKSFFKPYINGSLLNSYRLIKNKSKIFYSNLNYYKYKNNYPFQTIYIAAGCRTASTWLAEAISRLVLGFSFYHPRTFPYLNQGNNYDVDENLIREINNKLYVIRGHTPSTEINIKNINKFFKKCICTFRDPRDVIVSIKLHLDKNLSTSSFRDYGLNRILPWKTINLDHYANSSNKERFELVINNILPSIAEMSNDWVISSETNNYFVVKYEDLITNPIENIEKIMSYYNLQIRLDKIEKTVEKLNPRKENPIFTYFSKGKIGIWKDYLNSDQNIRVCNASQLYMERLEYN
tara:strand:+ start:504 stop:1388 length:885 start_codon:yes stop_codon:yes gene_type:complete